ncbi:MAG: AraC family transcriptional regulator [Bacteroidaceae bacterium]|nr:AraC family transcriptional regulator [Bacteroidaceae bacterium]
MTKEVENLSLKFVGSRAEEEKHYYVDEHVFIAMNAKDFGLKHLRTDQPYRVEEGRVMMVTAGWVHLIINLEEHIIRQQMLLVLLPNSIFEILEWSPDFDMQAFTFKDLPISWPTCWQACLVMDDDEWRLANEYIRLMWHQVQVGPLLPESMIHLQTALLLELRRIAERKESQWQQSASRQDKTFHQFLRLIGEHGLRERKIAFYADKLCITPGHLGAVIKRVSGLTVMQWLNRHTIQKAKVLLRYSDLPVWEVAERMNFANPSFFSKFFKNMTGMTPQTYRKSENK